MFLLALVSGIGMAIATRTNPINNIHIIHASPKFLMNGSLLLIIAFNDNIIGAYFLVNVFYLYSFVALPANEATETRPSWPYNRNKKLCEVLLFAPEH